MLPTTAASLSARIRVSGNQASCRIIENREVAPALLMESNATHQQGCTQCARCDSIRCFVITLARPLHQAKPMTEGIAEGGDAAPGEEFGPAFQVGARCFGSCDRRGQI